MEETPENGKELSHSAHTNGMEHQHISASSDDDDDDDSDKNIRLQPKFRSKFVRQLDVESQTVKAYKVIHSSLTSDIGGGE